MSRVKFLPAEEKSIWSFFLVKLHKREYDACTLDRSIWSDFTRRDENCRHTSSSIANHFKRHMISRLEDALIPDEDIKLILKHCCIKMTSESQRNKLKLRLGCDVRVDGAGWLRAYSDEDEHRCDFTMPPNAAPMGTSTPMAHRRPTAAAVPAASTATNSASTVTSGGDRPTSSRGSEPSNIAVVSPMKRPSDAASGGTGDGGAKDELVAKKARTTHTETMLDGGGDENYPVPIDTPVALTPAASASTIAPVDVPVALTPAASAPIISPADTPVALTPAALAPTIPPVGTAKKEEEHRQPVVEPVAQQTASRPIQYAENDLVPIDTPVVLTPASSAPAIAPVDTAEKEEERRQPVVEPAVQQTAVYRPTQKPPLPPSQQAIQQKPAQQSSVQPADQPTRQISTPTTQQPPPHQSTSAAAAVENHGRPTSAVSALSAPWYDDIDDELSFDVEPDVDLDGVELSEERRCDIALHERIRRYARQFSDTLQEDRYYRDLLRLRARLVAQRILPATQLLDDVPPRITVTLAELADLLKLLCA